MDPKPNPSNSVNNTMDNENRDSIIGGKIKHANRHVPKFLEIPESHVLGKDDEEDESRTTQVFSSSPPSSQPSSHPVQLVRDGRRLTAQRLLRNNVDDLTLTRPILIHDTAHSIGMKVLQHRRRDRPVTVRDVADLLGHDYPVHVIDVEVQEELDGWTLADLVDYFEDEERLFLLHQQERFAAAATTAGGHCDHDDDKNIDTAATTTNESSSTPPQRRQRRKAAQKCLQQTLRRPRVINQISLEFSKTPMIDHFLSPQFVRDLDWIDNAWPRTVKNDTTIVDGKIVSRCTNIDEVYPNVQYYCLTSEAGCYTDFHIDFGGTAVWYHVLSGEKEFCLIPPTPDNLSAYEDWLCSPDQAEVFFPTLISNPDNSSNNNVKNVFRVSLKAGQTFVIPSAWIHAVYTPSDSIVIGGNFLTGLDISLQLQVHKIEARSRVKNDYRLPYFLPLSFYAGGYYLSKLRRGDVVQREVYGLGDLIDALDHWWKGHGSGIPVQDNNIHQSKNRKAITTPPLPTIDRAAIESAGKNGCDTVEEFLAELRNEYDRVVRCIESGDGITPNPNFSLTPPVLLPTTATSTATTTTTSAPSKLKLRLSLKSSNKTPPPPHRTSEDHPCTYPVSLVTSSTSPTMTTTSDTNVISQSNKSSFRIVVPIALSASTPPVEPETEVVRTSTKRKAKRPREDTEWIDDGLTVDDEWIPEGTGGTNRRRRSTASKLTTSPRRRSSTSSNRSTKEATTIGATSGKGIKKQKSSRKEPEPTTSRQRLMKRIG